MEKEEKEEKRTVTEEELRKILEELPDGQFRIVSFGGAEEEGEDGGA